MRSILLALLLCGIIGSSVAQNADINLLRRINGPIHSRPDAFMRGMTNSILPLMIAVPTGIAIYNRSKTGSWSGSDRREALAITATLLASSTISVGLKFAVNRPRPFVTYPAPDIYQKDSHIGPHSFPSGHTSSAFALATSVCLYYPKWYVIAPAALWAITLGGSRLYLGVHYPTDVLIGALIGSGCAVLGYYVNRKLSMQ